jgi:SAM-dependent methyltransferase
MLPYEHGQNPAAIVYKYIQLSSASRRGEGVASHRIRRRFMLQTELPERQMTGLEQYRASDMEKARTADLVGMLPRNRKSVLDVGAREGFFSKLLTEHFPVVTAVDLQPLCFRYPRVERVAADATRLPFADNSFDCVFCAEVLEHIPKVAEACSEIRRVAKREVIIGVPFQQDTRVGRTTCQACGKVNPPWGHVNSFSERRLVQLFEGLKVVKKSFIGRNSEATNPVSAFLMNIAGNPCGTYDQEEGCIYCGSKLMAPPAARSLTSKVYAAAALTLNNTQSVFHRPKPNWIHLLFAKS